MSSSAATLLREARQRAGLSQSELAERAHVTQPTISAYEQGRREPAFATLQRLVEATGYTLDVQLVQGAARRHLPDTSLGKRLRRRRRDIVAAARRRGAQNVRVFGSVARGDDTEASDIDLLIDLDDDVSLVSLIGLERELSEIIGRPVDAVPARNLKPAVATRVHAEAIPL